MPAGFVTKLFGRLQDREDRLRSKSGELVAIVLRKPQRQALHRDPLSVAYTHRGPSDIVLSHDMDSLTHPALFYRDIADT